eukprot:COSAG02_NODE_37_length_48203_cov_57.745708_31_plen_141_part_00
MSSLLVLVTAALLAPLAVARVKRTDATLTHEDGAVYRGDQNEAGEKHGTGRYTWKDGSYYDGQWKNDEREGMGKYTYPSGGVYDGEWKDSKPHGNGTYTWFVDSLRCIPAAPPPSPTRAPPLAVSYTCPAGAVNLRFGLN